jgi:hypothetical protein
LTSFGLLVNQGRSSIGESARWRISGHRRDHRDEQVPELDQDVEIALDVRLGVVGAAGESEAIEVEAG